MLYNTRINKTSISKTIFPLTIFIASFYAGAGAFLYYLTFWALLLLILFFTTQTELSTGKLRIPTDHISIISFLYLGWIIFNYFFSQFKMVSFYAIWEIGSLPMMILIWKLMPDRDNYWKTLSKFFLIFGLFAAFLGLSDYISGKNNNINGQLLDPNTYAALLNAIFIPAAIHYLRGSEKIGNNAWISLHEITFFAIVLVIFLTSSRAVILLWPTLLITGIIYLVRSKLISYRRLVKLLLIITSAWLIFILLPAQEVGFQHTSSDSIFKPRMLMVQSALEIYKQFPLTGSGLGSYRAFYAGFRDPDERATSGDMAHNDYIQFLQEGGPIQLAFLLLIVIISVWQLLQIFFSKNQVAEFHNQNTEKLALLLIVSGLAIHALVNFIFYNLILSIIFGLYIARATDKLNLSDVNTWRPPIRSWLAKSALLLLLIIPWSLLLTDTIIMDAYNGYRLKPLIKLVKFEDIQEKTKFSEIASTIRPYNLLPRSDLLHFYQDNLQHARKNNELEKEKIITDLIVQEFKSILNISPINSGIYIQWAEMDLYKRNYNSAIKKLNKAILLERMSLDSYALLAQAHALNGDYEKAMSVLFVDAKDWLLISPKMKGDVFILETALGIAKQYNKTVDITHISEMILDRDSENEKAKESLGQLKTKNRF